MSDPEVQRLRVLCSKYRSRAVELETLFTGYVGGAIKKLLAARSAKPQEYQRFDEKLKIARTRGDLLSTFVQFDVDCKNAMTYDEFKQAMTLKGFLADEQAIENTFRGMDKDHNAMISEREFLHGVIGSMHSEEFSFKSQIDELNSEIRKVELKVAEDNDYMETLILENDQLREEFGGKANEQQAAEIDRLNMLVQELQDTHGKLTDKMKGEMEREILRLRDFGTVMRNQLNLLQRESVVGARAAVRKIMAMSGTLEDELERFDRETEASQLIAQVRQVFINLDEQHMGDMDFDKFQQAYQWLSVNASNDHLTQTFQRLDTQGRGLITEQDFLNAVIQDLDVTQFTTKAQFEGLMQGITDFDERISELLGQDISSRLRDRLANMRDDLNGKVKGLFSKMGVRIEDVISPEVLAKHLNDAFDKFDTSRDGRLGFKEFGEAWRFLGLKADADELREAFAAVDTDNSGLIDRNEFATAIKDNRLAELDLGLLLDAMGVELGSITDRYAAFNAKQERRRKQRKTMEATLAERCSDVVGLLCEITGKPRDLSKVEVQKELRETFDKFDRNGSGELNLHEYTQAWRFLGRPGSDADIKAAFEGVDIDRSGLIEWDEFVFSLMGEEAQRYGLLADIEIMIGLLGEVGTDIRELRGERSETLKAAYAAKDRLDSLRSEVCNRTDALVQRMKSVSGSATVITADDLDQQLTAAFKKADASSTGYLSVWQFSQAWSSLGLTGNEPELKELYESQNLGPYSRGLDVRAFIRLVKAERIAELTLRSRLSTLEYLLGKIEGGASSGGSTSARRRLHRQKQDEEVSALLFNLVELAIPATPEVLSNSYLSKRDRYNNLRDAFNRYDTDKTGVLNLAQYKDARRFVGGVGSDSELEKQFAQVDVENSGAIDFFEFAYSDMGKKATRVGTYGYAKILKKLINTAVRTWQTGGGRNPSNHTKSIRRDAREIIKNMTGFGGMDNKQLQTLGIKTDGRHSITAGMLDHILHD